MVIRLLPNQIPTFWEAIKFAALKSEAIPEENREAYLNDLLHSLLNGKSICAVRLTNEKQLWSMMILKFIVNKVTNERSLFITAVYNWGKRAELSQMLEEFSLLKEFAKREGCKYVSFESKNTRVWEVAEAVGFKESFKHYRMNLEVI